VLKEDETCVLTIWQLAHKSNDHFILGGTSLSLLMHTFCFFAIKSSEVSSDVKYHNMVASSQAMQ